MDAKHKHNLMNKFKKYINNIKRDISTYKICQM